MVRVCIIILYANYTTEETWWSLQSGVGKICTYILMSILIIGQLSCKISAYQILAKSNIIHPYSRVLLAAKDELSKKKKPAKILIWSTTVSDQCMFSYFFSAHSLMSCCVLSSPWSVRNETLDRYQVNRNKISQFIRKWSMAFIPPPPPSKKQPALHAVLPAGL